MCTFPLHLRIIRIWKYFFCDALIPASLSLLSSISLAPWSLKLELNWMRVSMVSLFLNIHPRTKSWSHILFVAKEDSTPFFSLFLFKVKRSKLWYSNINIRIYITDILTEEKFFHYQKVRNKFKIFIFNIFEKRLYYND